MLYEHESVVEAAVVGRPDDRWGEVPVAYVVVRAGATTTPDELVEHCRAQLARFKVPKEVVLVDALPRNPSGKVLKRELRTRTLTRSSRARPRGRRYRRELEVQPVEAAQHPRRRVLEAPVVRRAVVLRRRAGCRASGRGCVRG